MEHKDPPFPQSKTYALSADYDGGVWLIEKAEGNTSDMDEIGDKALGQVNKIVVHPAQVHIQYDDKTRLIIER